MYINIYSIVLFFIILIFSLILSVQDIKRMTVNIFILGAGILAGLSCHLIFVHEAMWIYIISGLLMGGFYFTVRKITKGKLGMADVCFGFFQGLFLAPKMIPVCLGIECLAALCMIKRFGKEKFPFIPFMAAGLIITFVIANVAKQSI